MILRNRLSQLHYVWTTVRVSLRLLLERDTSDNLDRYNGTSASQLATAALTAVRHKLRPSNDRHGPVSHDDRVTALVTSTPRG